MRITAALAVIGAMLVVGSSTTTAGNVVASNPCPAGSQTFAVGASRHCLTLETRVRIRSRFLESQDANAVARSFAITAAIVRRVASATTSRIVQDDAFPTAQDLTSNPYCTASAPPRAVADLRWTPAAAGADQRIAVATLAGGFTEGQFTSSPPLTMKRGSFVWTRMRGQANHTWVVLTLQRDGWHTSAPDTFVGPSCPVDYQR